MTDGTAFTISPMAAKGVLRDEIGKEGEDEKEEKKDELLYITLVDGMGHLPPSPSP